jgi:hypothetical protein
MLRNKFQSFIFFIMIFALTSLACGASNLPFMATETPTPTLTFTPSPTASPTPSSTPTPTSTPTSTPLPTGAITEEQSDGSTLFVDYDNQYQLSIPATWVVIPLGSADIADYLQTLSEENPAFADIAERFAQLDPDMIRVIAMNDDAKYFVNGFSTNITITAVEEKILSSMPIDFVTGALEETMKQQGATIIENNEFAFKNDEGVEIGTVELEQTTPTATGAKVPVHSKILIFQAAGKIIMVQLTTPKQFSEELLPVLDQIADTIKLPEM